MVEDAAQGIHYYKQKLWTMDTEVIWENTFILTETNTVTNEYPLNKEICLKFQSNVTDAKCILIKSTKL